MTFLDCALQENDPASDAINADIGSGLTARNLQDMRAFINLADFTCALLPACGPHMFKGWAYLVTLELVAASGQRPLLSGFHRMLTVSMGLTNAAGLLQPSGTLSAHTLESQRSACLSDGCFVVYVSSSLSR